VYEDDPQSVVKALQAENAREIERLRHSEIPQHLGMAVAGRVLAADLPSALMAQIQKDLDSGDLNQRWLRSMERIGAEGQAVVAVVGSLMAEIARSAATYVAQRAEEWEAAAQQLDGRASALEAQSARLEEVRKAVVRAAQAQ
jgi:hypothetical protein